jgi:hypothetical protein
MARLRGAPNVVELYEGPHFDMKIGLIWFSMRFYPERDLVKWHTRAPLTLPVKLGLVADLISALKAAHGANPPIVHRDLRPKNILIDIMAGTPRAVLIDFDIAYYEDFYRQRQNTVQALGDQRYIPPDVAGAGDSIALKLRRPSNDLYALAVTTLDLISGRQVPLDSTHKEIARALSQSHPTELSSEQRRSLAAFLHRAVRPSEHARPQTIQEYAACWNVATQPPRNIGWMVLATALCLTASIAVIVDWLWCTAEDSLWHNIALGLTGLLGSASATGALGWVASHVFPHLLDLRQRILTRLVAHPRLTLWPLMFLAAASTTLAFFTRPAHRLSHAVLLFGGECVGVDTSEEMTFLSVGTSRREFVLPVREVRCTATSGESAQIQRLSLANTLPPLRLIAAPRARALIRGVSGRVVTFGTRKETYSANVRCIKEPLEPPGLADNVPKTEPAMFVFGQLAGEVEILSKGTNVGLQTIGQGLSFVDATCADVPAYQRAEAVAKASALGVWADRPSSGTNSAQAERCPIACCPSGRPCQELTDCAARAKCLLCKLGESRPSWRLRLSKLDFPNSGEWHDVKVCLTTDANDCKQTCVAADNIGTNLSDFKCPYASSDLVWTTVEVLGKQKGSATEVRIAEQMTSISTIDTTAFCSGLRIGQMNTKRDFIKAIYMTVGLQDPTAAPTESGPLRLIVERGETKSSDMLNAYYYRLEAPEETLRQLSEVSIVATARGSKQPMNGPVAWKRCNVNGTATWSAIGSGTVRTCDSAVFSNGCECRFVLTSGSCAPTNEVQVKFNTGIQAQASFDACAAVGEHDGRLDAPGHKLELSRTAEATWQFARIETGRTMSCGLDCGPSPAASDRSP